MQTTPVSIPKEALVLLRSCLSVPGQAKTPEAIFKLGRILCDVLPQIDDRPDPVQDPAAWKTWAHATVEFQINPIDLDACRDAFKHALGKDAFGASEWQFKLQAGLQLGSAS